MPEAKECAVWIKVSKVTKSRNPIIKCTQIEVLVDKWARIIKCRVECFHRGDRSLMVLRIKLNLLGSASRPQRITTREVVSKHIH